jgi:predicted regulator of Ras-like GTPase activity (Roadblock/LC7/MglB family)
MTEGTSTQGYGRGKALDDLLEGLIRASSDFEGAVLVSMEGLLIATAWSSAEQAELQQGLDDSDIGAVACRAFEQSDQATTRLDRGKVERMILSGSRGNMIIAQVGMDALCVVLLKPEAKLGVASFEAARIGRQLESLLS